MDGYLWLKVIHLLAVMSWMAGLLYLPRLYVYHAEAGIGSQAEVYFVVMERRLLRAIMTPAMIVVWISGIWLAWLGGFFSAGWWQIKFALVVCMSGFHVFLGYERRRIADWKIVRTSRFYRIINEVPTVLMVGIVALAVLKP